MEVKIQDCLYMNTEEGILILGVRANGKKWIPSNQVVQGMEVVSKKTKEGETLLIQKIK